MSKRFAVAAQLLKGQHLDFTAENGANVTIDNAETVVNMLSESVLGTEVGRIIEIAATGDIRLALKMTRQFLQYGYSSTGKAIGIYQRTGNYKLPPHEALRAIMLGNQGIYRDSLSVIGNTSAKRTHKGATDGLPLFAKDKPLADSLGASSEQ